MATYGGDNNVIDCSTGRRATDWSLRAAGQHYECMDRACQIAAGFCGGCVRATFARFATVASDSRPLAVPASSGVAMREAINLEQLRRMAKALGLLLTDEELSEMIRDADRDDGGDVDEYEYMYVLKNSTWF